MGEVLLLQVAQEPGSRGEGCLIGGRASDQSACRGPKEVLVGREPQGQWLGGLGWEVLAGTCSGTCQGGLLFLEVPISTFVPVLSQGAKEAREQREEELLLVTK